VVHQPDGGDGAIHPGTEAGTSGAASSKQQNIAGEGEDRRQKTKEQQAASSGLQRARGRQQPTPRMATRAGRNQPAVVHLYHSITQRMASDLPTHMHAHGTLTFKVCGCADPSPQLSLAPSSVFFALFLSLSMRALTDAFVSVVLSFGCVPRESDPTIQSTGESEVPDDLAAQRMTAGHGRCEVTQ
jgi:hypothetical protein